MIKNIALAVALSAASLASVSAAHADELNVNVCTAKSGGNYEYTGKLIQEYLPDYKITVVNTKGSTENLELIKNGGCDVAIVQSDAVYVYQKDVGDYGGQKIADLYNEYAHLLCRRDSGITDLGGLNDKTKVLIGEPGSGSQVTWRGMVLADKEFGSDFYTKIPVVYKDSLTALNAGDAACLLYTGTPNSKFMTVKAQKFADSLVLVPVQDRNFDDVTVKNKLGKTSSVWAKGELPYSSYEKIMPTGLLGRKDVPTISVTAQVVISEAAAETGLYDDLGLVIPDIQKRLAADKNLTLEK